MAVAVVVGVRGHSALPESHAHQDPLVLPGHQVPPNEVEIVGSIVSAMLKRDRTQCVHTFIFQLEDQLSQRGRTMLRVI